MRKNAILRHFCVGFTSQTQNLCPLLVHQSLMVLLCDDSPILQALTDLFWTNSIFFKSGGKYEAPETVCELKIQHKINMFNK